MAILESDWFWVVAIGFIVGLLGKLIRRERDPGGFFMPMLVGMGGAALAAILGPALGLFDLGTVPGYLGVTAGAVILAFFLSVMPR